MTFDPSAFVKTAKQTWDLKIEYDKFIADNAHLAAPFHIAGLEGILPKQYPGNLTVHFAKSHHGKSTALRNSAFKSQKRVENTDYMIGIVSLEDTAETLASKQVLRYGGNSMMFQDDQMVFVGNSFGMSAANMGKLNPDNVIACLQYALEILPGKKGYSHIYIDYAQIMPANLEFANADERLQIRNFVQCFFNAAKQFKCPIDFASQALLKQQRDNYTDKMRIPGAADLKGAGELYEIPDIAISYWQPKHEPNTPVGTLVEDGGWTFRVTSDLVFIRIAKWRNAELMGFVGEKDIVGRVFPCFIQPDGEITYDAEWHRKHYLKPAAELHGVNQ